jgi:peptidoglycan/xylan/chitin deacetylase (PgdA/CDA1 family)
MIARMRRGVAIGLGVSAAWTVPAAAPLAPRLADALGVRTRIDAPSAVALTFDDGPHAEGTPLMLEILATADTRATFFMVGEQIRRAPGLAADVAAAGHAVAIHGYRHRNLLRLPSPAVADDLDRAQATIADAVGITPTLHRPPYGIYSWPALRAVRARGWTPLLWTRWGRDWTRRATPAGIATKLAAGVRAGDVLLLHDADHYSAPGSHRRTAAALPHVLETIRAAGLDLVALDQPSGR